MSIVLYYLSFLPLLLVALTVHELGHLVAAWLLRVKTAGFQIGVGRRLLSLHTGRTRIALRQETLTLGPQERRPIPGERAAVYVVQADDGTYVATALMPEIHPRKLQGPHQEAVWRQNNSHMQLRGLVREIDDHQVVIADMTWGLHSLPFMAGVFLPEDPERRIKNIYNVVSWPKQLAIIFAGPLANVLLMAAVLFILAAFPITSPRSPILTVITVSAESPAQLAGLRSGDQLVQVGPTLMPRDPEIRAAIRRAGETGRAIDLRILRQGETLSISLHPRDGVIGVNMSELQPVRTDPSMSPDAMGQRLTRLSEAYFGSLAALVAGLRTDQEGPPEVTGLLLGAHQTAQAVEFAGLKAWLAIMGAFTMSIALLNLLPIPPLDGYRIITQTIQALRHGKPISPRVDHAMTLSGFTVIYAAALYLLLNDVIYLLE